MPIWLEKTENKQWFSALFNCPVEVTNGVFYGELYKPCDGLQNHDERFPLGTNGIIILTRAILRRALVYWRCLTHLRIVATWTLSRLPGTFLDKSCKLATTVSYWLKLQGQSHLVIGRFIRICVCCMYILFFAGPSYEELWPWYAKGGCGMTSAYGVCMAACIPVIEFPVSKF